VGVFGSPASLNGLKVGTLYAEGVVKLRKGRLTIYRGLVFPSEQFYTSSALTTLTAALWFGAAGNVSYLSAQQNNIGCSLVIGGAQALQLVMPASFSGAIEVEVYAQGTGITVNPTSTAGANSFVSQIFDMYTQAGTQLASYGTLSGTVAFIKSHWAVTVNPTGNNNVINFGAFTATTITVARLRVNVYSTLGPGMQVLPGGASAAAGGSSINWVNQAGASVIPT